nr:putative reverse transcriptase domain-containing protein [Tanacetum cinerariifolium]
QLGRVHDTFHVSNLKKCMFDEPLAIPLDEIQIDDTLHSIKEPVEIMDHEVKRLKQSRILIVKVCWNSRRGHEFTWERKDQMQKNQEDIKKLIAQRVANVIETIAIYETKSRMVYDSMDRVGCQGFKVTKDSSNKRKWEGDPGVSSSKQQNKRHKAIMAHVVGPRNKKEYAKTLRLCNKCKFCHIGACTAKCGNCKRVGHRTIDCRNPVLRAIQ